MSDFPIGRLDPIARTGDSAIQSPQPHTGSRQRRPQPEAKPSEADEIEANEEEKHHLDGLA